jgi:predicted amino acid-binding ACT domain protein
VSQPKPRRATVKLVRTVTEIAVVLLDRHGIVEEIEEVLDEHSYEVHDMDMIAIRSFHE